MPRAVETRRVPRVSPLAGRPAPKEMLVDVARLEREYFERREGRGLPKGRTRVFRTTKPKSLAPLEKILLGENLGVLGGERVVSHSPQRRQGRKENAKQISLVAAMLLRVNP